MSKSNRVQVSKWREQKEANRAAQRQRKALNISIKNAISLAKGGISRARAAEREERMEKAGIAKEAQADIREQARDFTRAVGKLTNWQRNKWARAGYPGLIKSQVDGVLPFVTLVKPTTHSERVLMSQFLGGTFTERVKA